MDRRSWLWRRKSSEKSPGESESSGSISSERLLDDQAYPIQSAQSLDQFSSKSALDDEVNDNVKALREKLSAALLNISAREELINQHAKVAEEAVSGWEKAESEVLVLKQQLESANLKNSSLEDRISHLDGALKECLRKLRQVREDQDKKINEIVSKKNSELESTISILETELTNLQTQLETAKTEAEEASSNLSPKLEAFERENSTLKFKLHSLSKELEIKTVERDLSTQAAELASKQNLVSIKKINKLESEIRRLNAICFKASSSTPFNNSSNNNTNNNKPSLASSVVINLMEDFLEMERLVSLPDEVGYTKLDPSDNENALKTQLEVMIHRTAELEEKVEKMESEKMELEIALKECQKEVKESEVKRVEMEKELDLVKRLKRDIEEEVEAIKVKRESAELELNTVKLEMEALLLKIGCLEEDVDKERAFSGENMVVCGKLEGELLRLKNEAENFNGKYHKNELKITQEKELEMAAYKFAECHKTIASLGKLLQSIATFEDLLNMDSHEEPLEHVSEGLSIGKQRGLDSSLVANPRISV